MSDLTQYFGLQDEIKKLKARNESLREELTRALDLKSKYKIKCKPESMDGKDLALALIVRKYNGENDLQLKQIAELCSITYPQCKYLSFKYMRKTKQ